MLLSNQQIEEQENFEKSNTNRRKKRQLINYGFVDSSKIPEQYLWSKNTGISYYFDPSLSKTIEINLI